MKAKTMGPLYPLVVLRGELVFMLHFLKTIVKAKTMGPLYPLVVLRGELVFMLHFL